MNWLWSNFDQVWALTLDHVALSIVPVVLGFLLSLPLGWLANRYHATRGIILTVGGVLYSIPSLPLFVVLPVIVGTSVLDPANVVIALTIYAVALMVRTTADALAAVEPNVIQSATAVGFSGWGRFWKVELPLAGPVLLAGLRVVSVSTVSLVSVGALVGVNSLGYLFLNGFQRNFPTEILIGIIGTVIIALVFDAILVLIGRLVLPWTKRAPRMRTEQNAVATVAGGESWTK